MNPQSDSREEEQHIWWVTGDVCGQVASGKKLGHAGQLQWGESFISSVISKSELALVICEGLDGRAPAWHAGSPDSIPNISS